MHPYYRLWLRMREVRKELYKQKWMDGWMDSKHLQKKSWKCILPFKTLVDNQASH